VIRRVVAAAAARGGGAGTYESVENDPQLGKVLDQFDQANQTNHRDDVALARLGERERYQAQHDARKIDDVVKLVLAMVVNEVAGLSSLRHHLGDQLEREHHQRARLHVG